MNGYAPGSFEIETASGRYVDLFVPLPETIALEDIAHGLSHVCRFAGQAQRFSSVAEHAVLVSRKLEVEGFPELAFAGLHHDSAEAYLGDLTRPMKLVLDRLTPSDADLSFREVEAHMECVIHRALAKREEAPDLWALADFEHKALKDADDWALALEAGELLPSQGKTWGIEARWPLVRPSWWWAGLAPSHACRLWMRRHAHLTEEAA